MLESNIYLDKKVKSAAVACEIKIGVARSSYEEVQALIERVRKACAGDYQLDINLHGAFSEADTSLD